jgi:hypothetical protein
VPFLERYFVAALQSMFFTDKIIVYHAFNNIVFDPGYKNPKPFPTGTDFDRTSDADPFKIVHRWRLKKVMLLRHLLGVCKLDHVRSLG